MHSSGAIQVRTPDQHVVEGTSLCHSRGSTVVPYGRQQCPTATVGRKGISSSLPLCLLRTSGLDLSRLMPSFI